MRVVFFGNHTVGVRALSILSDYEEVVGVVAHPPDPEDGSRYESVFEFANGCGLPAIRGKANDPEVMSFVYKAAPDLLWITDYRYLLPRRLVTLPPLGVINLHPSLLPKYRGRAPINWAIIHGESKLGLTAHFVDEAMDSGDVIIQEGFELNQDEDVGDALYKLIPLYQDVTRRVLGYLRNGHVPRTSQNVDHATSYPARKPSDGQIVWNLPAASILNFIRAVAAPYPGAFSFLGVSKIIIWQAKLGTMQPGRWPGEIVGFDKKEPIISCKDGTLILKKIQFCDGAKSTLSSGDRLTAREKI
jgi:methionyl-tRNA formyltransferase